MKVEIIVTETPKYTPEKTDCEGCDDDFYNGKNPNGVEECWKFEHAKIILTKEVGINQRPPWKQEPHLRISCYKRKGFVYVDGKREK